MKPEVAVGKRFEKEISRWPEMVEFYYTKAGYELRIFWNTPSKEEIQGVRKGKVDLALFADQEAFLMLYRIENTCDWSYTPFDWFRVPEGFRLFPSDDQLPPVLRVTLIDANNGIVRAVRDLTLTEEFVEAIRRAVDQQIATGTTWLDDRLQRLYKEYFSAESFLGLPETVHL